MKKIELKDSGLVLEPLTHTYHDASGNFYQGVTGTLIQRAFPNLYAGVSDEILEHAAHRGTVAHENIEKFLMGDAVENRFNAISLASKRLLSENGITCPRSGICRHTRQICKPDRCCRVDVKR